MIRPLLEYCAQTLSYGRYSQPSLLPEADGFAKELEHLQTQILKTLINCPHSTSPAIVRLFCGVEPLACRLEILKVRYFWKLLNGPVNATIFKILQYKKNNFLGFNKGFAHEVFNICCKYNILYLWHGSSANHINPLLAIKIIIISKNLREDLEKGRSKKCSFANIFLRNPFAYQKNYHLPEPFCQPDQFATPNGRKRFVKAILHPCSYKEECLLCRQIYTDKLYHFLTECPRLSKPRKQLHLKLELYNFPLEKLLLNDKLLGLALEKNAWRNSLTKFLIETDF